MNSTLNGYHESAAACISVLNEAETIYDLVLALRGMGMMVYVVDNGSQDNTVAQATRGGATVVQFPYPIGIGPSLMRAWWLAVRDGAQRVLQIDAGGSHDPMDAPRLLEMPSDLVIGSRFVEGARFVGSWQRYMMSRLAACACNFAQSGSHYHDWTSGYRVLTARAIDKLLRFRYRSNMHAWQMEVLARAGQLGLSVVEVPIVYVGGRSSLGIPEAWEAFQIWMHILNHIGHRKH